MAYTLMDLVIELEDVTEQIEALKQRRIDLHKEISSMRKPFRHQYNQLIDVIRTNPGIDRRGIEAYFPQFSGNQLSALITRARRNYKVIENRGTRGQPEWYLVEGEK